MQNWQILVVVMLALAFVLVIVITLATNMKRRRRVTSRVTAGPESIDVLAMTPKPPPAKGPQLTYFNAPVRLAVLVIAPAGRGAGLPSKDDLPDIVEQLLPGLMNVLAAHQPVYRTWPQQLSSGGFAHSFARLVPLPGDRGKGTPWCSVAGRFQADGRTYLAGMVLCSEKANAHGHQEIDKPGGWLDMLRIAS